MAEYIPPKVWTEPKNSEGTFASINKSTSGVREIRELPKGNHPFQLYSLATPNGIKVTVMFEELLLKGHTGAEYDAFPINILQGEQFGSGFVDINLNSKIPALLDNSTENPIRIFESGSILLYLAEKFGEFIPRDISGRTETLNWLFWQMGSAPYLGGGFGHFYAYAPKKLEYPINRFAMESKRQLDVLDQRLETHEYVNGVDYSIADIAIWPWYGALVLGELYNAAEFLQVETYKNVLRWAKKIAERPAVKRGIIVNKAWGDGDQLPERHDAADFEQFHL